MGRIAVLFCGHLRNFRSCYQSLYGNFLSHYDCDLFIHTWDKLNYNLHSWHGITDGHDIDTDYKEILSLYHPKALQIERQTILDPNNILVCEKTPLNNVLNQWNSFHKCYQLKMKYQLEQNVQYDFCVKLRPDIMLYQRLQPERYDLNSLNLSQNYGNLVDQNRGATDMIFFGNDDVFREISNFFIDLNVLLDKYPPLSLTRAESYWILYLRDKGVKYFLTDYHYYSHFQKG